MKDNRTEELKATANTAEAEIKEEGIAAGPKKFKDVQALIDAYTALEAEFTRRSQRLKELEANKEQDSSAASICAQATSEDALSQAVNSDRGNGVHALTDEEKNAVIEEYLSGIRSNRSVPFVTVGGAVKAARVTPKTIREAGSLARSFFDNKEN
ncbi:MAG: hypothetical protein ACI4MN_02615 [Candidatus Coproplasma sp.]